MNLLRSAERCPCKAYKLPQKNLLTLFSSFPSQVWGRSGTMAWSWGRRRWANTQLHQLVLIFSTRLVAPTVARTYRATYYQPWAVRRQGKAAELTAICFYFQGSYGVVKLAYNKDDDKYYVSVSLLHSSLPPLLLIPFCTHESYAPPFLAAFSIYVYDLSGMQGYKHPCWAWSDMQLSVHLLACLCVVVRGNQVGCIM